MNLKFYKGNVSNFGDALNEHIWPSILQCEFDNYDDIGGYGFYGIGTLIDGRIPLKSKSIIFGTGIRDVKKDYSGNNWNIYFVRGPITARVLNLKSSYCVSDPAYCLKFLSMENEKSKLNANSIGLIPHFLSLNYIDWEKTCDQLGYTYIDPRNSVPDILESIQGCKAIITEAMHGAIIADYYRIPWARFRFFSHFYESPLVSEVKWNDWLASIEKNIYSHDIPFLMKGTATGVKGALRRRSQNYLLTRSLASIKEFNLSSDSVLDSVFDRLFEQVNSFKKDASLYT